MSEHEALARFHYGCAARHHKVEIRRLWRSRCMMYAQRSPSTGGTLLEAPLPKERAIRRRELKRLWARLKQLSTMQLTREELLMKLGAARDQSRIAWRLRGNR
jgi:hypothetical protein